MDLDALNGLSNISITSDDDEKQHDDGIRPDKECSNCKILQHKLQSLVNKRAAQPMNQQRQSSSALNQSQQTNNAQPTVVPRKPHLEFARLVLRYPTWQNIVTELREDQTSQRDTPWTLVFDSMLQHCLIGPYQYVETFVRTSRRWNQVNPTQQFPTNLPPFPADTLVNHLLPNLQPVDGCSLPDGSNLLNKLRNAVMHGSYHIRGFGSRGDPRKFEFVDDYRENAMVGAVCDAELVCLSVGVCMRDYSIELCDWALALPTQTFNLVFGISGTTLDHIQNWKEKVLQLPDHRDNLTIISQLMENNGWDFRTTKEILQNFSKQRSIRVD